MSDAGLTRDGATYKKVTSRVKTAVYGAVYGKTTLNGIKNDYNVYYWCNRSYKSNDKKNCIFLQDPMGLLQRLEKLLGIIPKNITLRTA